MRKIRISTPVKRGILNIMGDINTTEVTVIHEADASKLLFDIDGEAASQALREIFPGLGELKIKISDRNIGHYGAFMQFTDANAVEVCPNAFKEIFETVTEPKTESEVRTATSMAKLLGQRLEDFFDDSFSTYPRGYRPRDIVVRDKAYYHQLVDSGADELTAQSQVMSKKAAEVTTHEVEHISQSQTGKFAESAKKALKTSSVGLGATIATCLALTVLSHNGQIPIAPEQVEKLIYNPAVLIAGWATALVPALLSMRNSMRGIEKSAYDKAFESGDKLISAIHVNENVLKEILDN